MLTQTQLTSIPIQYALQVQSGEILVGHRIKQAVARFFSWVETAAADGYILDHSRGMHIINFFPTFLKHTKGKMAGQPFILSPYQQFTLYNVFGWVDTNGIRRISNVYEKVAKKNGKTAQMAGVGLYGISFDDEREAEVYIGATKEEQAKLCFNQAVSFIESSAALRQIGFSILQKEIKFKPNGIGAFIKPLGGDSKTQDGINPHFAIIDEYHAHRDDSVKENLESAMVSRSQPIVYTITTAGVYVAGVCKQFEDVCIQILDGIKTDDHFFIMIHDLDENDDWQDKNNWIKANPNLGYSVTMDKLLVEYHKAVNQPSKAPNFKTKHLNLWVDAPEIWIPDEIWMQGAAPINLENFKTYGAFAAVDLSTTIDITAFIVLSEPDAEGVRDVLPFFFCNKEAIDKRSKEDRVPYRYWADAGYIIATPGNTVDYTIVKNKIIEIHRQYNLNCVEFDKWNAHSMMQELQEENVPVAFFSQAITVISHPTKQFERLVYEGKIRHGGHPVLRWMLSGCQIISDPNENIKVHKGKSNNSTKRVDGIIATIIALGASLTVPDTSEQSAYNNPETEIFI